MVANIDLENKEVSKKLEEIKSSFFKGNVEMRLQDDVPTCLGLGVSLPNKKVKMYLDSRA